jgi:hypothetical protein
MDDGRRPRQYPSRRAIVLEGIIAVADCDADPDSDRGAWERAWARFNAALLAAGWVRKDDHPEGAE